jgi:hypothetical protein
MTASPKRSRTPLSIVALVAVVISAVQAPLLSAPAAEPTKMYHMGLVLLGSPGPLNLAFDQRLRELGWVEGQNLAIDRRFADGNELTSCSPKERNVVQGQGAGGTE